MLKRSITFIAAFFGAITLFWGTAMTATITVDDDGPADYSSIKEAVEAASEGDTVLVKAGVYHESGIDMKDNMILQGAGIDSTIIVNDLPPNRSDRTTVRFNRVEGAKIEGFTISGHETLWPAGPTSPGWWNGKGGIGILECSPTIVHNRVVNFGCGITIADWHDPAKAQPVINGNTITNNEVGVQIYPYPSDPQGDVRWNWWGTTHQTKIADGIRQIEGPVTYQPWLTEPVTSFEKTPGIHYNNIYRNDSGNTNPDSILGEINFAFGCVFLSVQNLYWGTVKRKFK